MITDATTALLEAMVTFFPEPRRRLLKTAAAKYAAVQTKAMEMVQAKLDSPELEKQLIDQLRIDLTPEKSSS